MIADFSWKQRGNSLPLRIGEDLANQGLVSRFPVLNLNWSPERIPRVNECQQALTSTLLLDFISMVLKIGVMMKQSLASGGRPNPMRLTFSVPSSIVSALIAALVFETATGGNAVRAETTIERGAYLVNAVAACATCHTPRSPPGPALSGGNSFKVGPSTVLAPNITPDRETGIGAWTDAQIIAAIRDDMKPDGSRIGPPMPQMAFASISDADVAAIVAYIRMIAPVRHKVEASGSEAHRPPSGSSREAKRSVPAPSFLTAFDRGRYLVNGPAHCVECHAIGAERPGVSSRIFKGPWGAATARTLSPDVVKDYPPGDFKRLVLTGLRADGSRLVGPMPIASYKGLRDGDVADILAYLSAAPSR